MMQMETIGASLAKRLFESLEVDVTAYCNAAVDAAYEYCVEAFKEACKKAGIEWNKSWEEILYG